MQKKRFFQFKKKAAASLTAKLAIEKEQILHGEKPKPLFSNLQQRTAAQLLIGFFTMMVIFTLLSRTATGFTIAKVTTDTAKPGILIQRYSIPGTIESQNTLNIVLPGGLRISKTMVQTGDYIDTGDQILALDLNEMQSFITQLQNEIHILDLQIQNLSIEVSHADPEQIRLAEHNLNDVQENYNRLNNSIEITNNRIEEDLTEAQSEYEQLCIDLENAKIKAKEEQIETAKINLNTANQAKINAEYNRTAAVTASENALKNTEASAEYAYINARQTLYRAQEELQAAKDFLTSLDEDASEEEYITAKNAVDAARFQVINSQNQVESANHVLNESVKQARDDLKQTKEWQDYFVSQAEDAVQKAEAKLTEAKERNDFSNEPSVSAAQDKVDLAENNLKTAARSYEDTCLSQEEQILQAKKAVELAEIELASAKRQTEQLQQSDHAVSRQNEIEKLQYENERNQKQQLLNQIEKLYAQNGVISAPAAGTIKMILDSDITQDNQTAIALSCADQGFQFTAKIEASTATQLTIGDTGTLSYTDRGKSLSVPVQISSISSPDEGNQIRITAQLTEEHFISGLPATLYLEKNSDRYPMILPISALRIMEGKTAVLVVRETPSVLGIKQTVEEVDVIVKAQTTETIAVEGKLFSDDSIVITASKPIKKGDRVRVEK